MGGTVPAAPLTFDAPLVLGKQIDARANHPELANRDFLLHGDRRWTYRRYRDECVRVAHLLLSRLGPIDERRPGNVAMLLENHLELLSLYGACGFAGLTLFAINTGLRGETLAGVLNQSRARLLVVDQRFEADLERIQGNLEHIAPENILVLRTSREPTEGHDFLAAVDREVGPSESSVDTPGVDVTPETNLMVIYTSGTTGLPKGIINNHFKLLAIGFAISHHLELDRDSVGYACMPLYHSNSIFLGLQPAFQVGGKLAMRERFSASRFVPDVLRYGVTFWNYVGEPVHYILDAIEREFDGDERRIREEITRHPANRLRFALGNGASPPDIDRFVDWLGLEDMFELYGSTEAAISTFRRIGDPRGSVGEVTDPAVKILDERGNECPPAQVDVAGKITNYAEAVGEICRVAPETGLFQGYFDNAKANRSKYQDGVYHSGDLGHILLMGEKRYLFFDGRTDDWIRKDGENFSASQVARILVEHPDIVLSAAYGVPSPVSDELVMVALKLRPGVVFDPKGFFDYCEDQVQHGGMDRKWFPDFVRIVEEFEFTKTQKILVRNLKRVHFDLDRVRNDAIYWRQRGDAAFRAFLRADYALLRKEFEKAERLQLLDA
jgi:fatty-acyl-CoA synthase